MKTIKEIRLSNLELLVSQHGSVKVIAELTGKPPALISQIKNGGAFGDKLARDIENSLSLAVGWLDNDHMNDAQISIFDALNVLNTEIASIKNDQDLMFIISAYKSLTKKEKKVLVVMAKQLSNRDT